MQTVGIPTRDIEVGLKFSPDGKRSEKVEKFVWGRKYLHVVVNDKYRYDRAGEILIPVREYNDKVQRDADARLDGALNAKDFDALVDNLWKNIFAEAKSGA